MTGKSGFSLERYAGRIALTLLLIFVYLYGILSYLNMPGPVSVNVLLTGSCPDRAAVERILEAEREKEESRELCFLSNGGIRTVSREELGRQSQALVVGLLGNAELYDWRCQGFAAQDWEGCIIDKKTARELFGSTDAVGNVLELESVSYTVRAVADWKSPMVVIRPKAEENIYTQMFLKAEGGNAVVQQLLMSHGLSGVVEESGFLKPSVLFLLCLLPGAMGVRLFVTAWQERKRSRGIWSERVFWNGMLILLIAAVVYLIWTRVRIPADWIPVRWSDLEFWGERFARWKEGVLWYLMMPKTIPQTEAVLYGVKSGISAVVSLGLYGILVRRQFSPRHSQKLPVHLDG